VITKWLDGKNRVWMVVRRPTTDQSIVSPEVDLRPFSWIVMRLWTTKQFHPIGVFSHKIKVLPLGWETTVVLGGILTAF
jgi:hypothetical protein